MSLIEKTNSLILLNHNQRNEDNFQELISNILKLKNSNFHFEHYILIWTAHLASSFVISIEDDSYYETRITFELIQTYPSVLPFDNDCCKIVFEQYHNMLISEQKGEIKCWKTLYIYTKWLTTLLQNAFMRNSLLANFKPIFTLVKKVLIEHKYSQLSDAAAAFLANLFLVEQNCKKFQLEHTAWLYKGKS